MPADLPRAPRCAFLFSLFAPLMRFYAALSLITLAESWLSAAFSPLLTVLIRRGHASDIEQHAVPFSRHMS